MRPILIKFYRKIHIIDLNYACMVVDKDFENLLYFP